jgi:hypothetical protein
MFIKLSLFLVVITLDGIAAPIPLLIKVDRLSTFQYDGKYTLEKLLGQEPLTAESTAFYIVKTRERESVEVAQTTLNDLFKMNWFQLSKCVPESFVEKFSTCNEQVRAYPNLKNYCDECLKLHKNECKKSPEIIFRRYIESGLFKRIMYPLLRKEVDCKAAGYDMAGTLCLADFMSKLDEKEFNIFRTRCKNFASTLELAVNLFDLDRERPLGVLGQDYPWLETAARHCGKVDAALKQLDLFKKGESKMNES